MGWIARKRQFLNHLDLDRSTGSCLSLLVTVVKAVYDPGGDGSFLYYLYLTLTAVNKTEAFKYRIEGDDLYLYDMINGKYHTVGEKKKFSYRNF